jgi:hypothetical protein
MGKSIRKIVNWKQYNQALVSRDSLTFRVDETAIKAWCCHEHHGGRGRGFSYSDVAIETALMANIKYRNPSRGPIAHATTMPSPS